MSKKARSRQHRRDRRKAKASDWARQPKTNNRVGHGSTGSGRASRIRVSISPKSVLEPQPKIRALKVTIEELIRKD